MGGRAEDLRRRAAERLLRVKPAVDLRPLAPDGTRAELEVHQAELEIQNEDLREARSELARARDRFQSLFDLAPLGYLILDSAGRIQTANWTAAALLGLPRPSLEGAFLSNLAHRSDAFAVQRHVLAAVNLRVKQTLEARFGGGATVLHLETIVVPGERGEAEYRTALVDVSRQRRLDQRLSDREARLQAILEHASEAIVTMDRFGLVESFNPAAEGVFGYEAVETIGRHVQMLLPSPGEERGEEHVARYLRGRLIPQRGQPVEGLRKDGTRVPLEASVAELARGEGGFVAILVDVRERDTLRQRAVRAQQSELLQSLCAGIVHDFNNVLNGVAVTTELALGDLPDHEQVRGRLCDLRGWVRTGSGLTDQLLEIARGRSAPASPNRLDDALARMLPLLRALVGPEVMLELRAATPGLCVSARPGQLEQVFMNLAANARDAMDRRGTLTIHSTAVELGIEPDTGDLPPGTYARVDVTDTGRGMDEETATRAFEPLFTTKGVAGSGLGLGSVRHVIEQLQGRISFETEQGRGTRFTLLIPAAEATDPPLGAPADEAPWVVATPPEGLVRDGHPGPRVLLVEDHPLTRMTMTEALEEAGYRVTEAATAHDALARGADVDLVVLDVSLPDGPGWKLAAQMRERRPRVPVLYVAGLGPEDDPDLRAALELPRTACLVKPLSLDELWRMAARLTGADRPSDAPDA